MEKKIKTIGRTTIVSGAAYWDFKTNPIFTGNFTHEVMGEDVNKPGEKKLIGYNFIDLDGQDWVIGASHAIGKALEVEVGGTMVRDLGKSLEITWLGKVERVGKPSYNRFNIDLIG